MNKTFWLGCVIGISFAIFIFSFENLSNRGQHTLSSRDVAGGKPILFSATVEDAFQIFSATSAKNVEQAVALLDDSFFDIKNFALVYDSRSIQPAVFEYPRVILFGDKGKLALAFNHRLGFNGGTLELIQWRSGDRRWELREISFGDQGPQLSAANPQVCIDCHGKDPRPNWEGYPVWAGVYGSSFQLYHPQTEVKGYDKFLAVRARDAIYSRLELAGKNKNVSTANDDDLQLLESNNASRNRDFGNLNAQRIARQIKNQLQQKNLIYPILSTLSGCPNLSDYFNDKKFDVFLKSQNDLAKKIAITNHQRILYRQARGEMSTVDAFATERGVLTPYKYAPHELDNIKYIAPLRALLVYFEGLDTEKWSMSFMERDMSYTNSRGTSFWANIDARPDIVSVYRSLRSEFQLTALPLSPTPAPSNGSAYVSVAPEFCQSLRNSFVQTKLPIQRLKRPPEAPEFMSDYLINRLFNESMMSSEAAFKIVTSKCTVCHDPNNYDGIPNIPLTNAYDLGTYKNGLAMQYLRTFKMPRSNASARISLKERAALIYYLEKAAMAPFYEKYFKGNDALLDGDTKSDY